MLILGTTSNVPANLDRDLVSTMASTMMVYDWTEFLDWVITPKLSDDFNYHTSVARGEAVVLYTRSASAMIRGLKKVSDLDDSYRLFSASDECLGFGYGAFELSGFTKTKVGGGLGVIGHNVKQFLVRGFVKAVGNTGFVALKAKKAMAGDDWDKMTVDLQRKKWARKLNSTFGGVVQHYQSLGSVGSSQNPFASGFAVYVTHSSNLPTRTRHGGVVRSISPSLTYAEIATQLENINAEKSPVFKH